MIRRMIRYCKKFINNIIKFIANPRARFLFLNFHGFYNFLSDEKHIRKQYSILLGQQLNLNNPQSFNEKTQWLKLYDRNTLYTNLVDKFLVRNFVQDVLGEEYLIPLIGTWNSAEEINFEELPDSFVLKCNHNSGFGMCICKNKKQLDVGSVKKQLEQGMRQNYYLQGREWPYKNVERKIIAEKYMVDESGIELKDYKIFTFSGRAKYIQVDYDRFTDHHRNFYTLKWEYVPFTTCYPTNSKHKIEKPYNLDRLIRAAEQLAHAAGDPKFVRVDMYVIGKRIYFGEMTFYHGSGYEKFMPKEYDNYLGQFIEI